MSLVQRLGVVMGLLCLMMQPALAAGDEKKDKALKPDQIKVKITRKLPWVDVNHFGEIIRVMRIQDEDHKLTDDFARTSRPCPPFCIQPMQAAPGVKTVGELELLHFVTHEVKSGKGILIDARMPSWYETETIPGAINLPFIVFTTPSRQRDQVFKLLGGVKDKNGRWKFDNAPTLMLFCNGPWCDQSPRAIRALVKAGYPASKLLYYRGGMQLWKILGLTTVIPSPNLVGDDDEDE